MSIAALIRSMVAAGAPGEAIALAVEAIEAAQAEVAAKRAAGAERVRRYRERKAAETSDVTHGNVTVTHDVTLTPPPASSPLCPPFPPAPPNPPYIPPPSPPTPDISRAGFAEFWSAYPRKTGKGAAEKAWPKAAKRMDARQIIAAAKAFADDPGRDPTFTPHPATWLNQARFEDEPDGNANHGNRGRMGGGDKPTRRNPAMDMLRDAIGGLDGFADAAEADAGASSGYRGTWPALPARQLG